MTVEEPEAPSGTRAVRGDVVMPLELVYDGFRDGVHQWVTVVEVDVRETKILIDVMPPHTNVIIRTPYAAP